MKKSWFVLLICLFLGLSIFSGCTDKPDNPLLPIDNEEQEELPKSQPDEHFFLGMKVLSVWINSVEVDPSALEKDPLAGEPLVPKYFGPIVVETPPGSPYPAESKKAFGYLDIDGRLAIEPQYDEAFVFSEGLALVKKDGKFFIINTRGDIEAEITDEEFNEIFLLDADKFIDGNIRFSDSDFGSHGPNYEHVGFVNTKGEVTWYPKAWSFSEGMAFVAPNVDQDGKRGFIDSKGDLIIELSEDEGGGSFHEGLAFSSKTDNGPYGYMDKTGKYVIEPQFKDVKSFFDGVAAATLDGQLWGYIDHTGKWVIEPQYGMVSDFNEGFAVVDKRYLIDKSGKVTVDCQKKGIDELYFYSEGIYGARKGETLGYIDSGFSWIIESDGNRIDYMNPCQDGLICVELGMRQDYYNKNGLHLGFYAPKTYR